jgi:ABC-type multidrug transport system ATPase subunit
MGAVIEIEGLSKTYRRRRGRVRALDGLDLSVRAGGVFGFLGPNGSGKTTTVKILVTLLRQTSGIARVGGFDVQAQADRVRGLIGYAGQSVGVDDDLTAAENLALGGNLHGMPHGESQRRAGELLEVFSLGEVAGVRAGRLSGGLDAGWTSPRPWCTVRRSCSWTSRPRGWIPSRAMPCGGCFGI